MSTSAAVWLTYGGLIAAFVLFLAGHEVAFRVNCWRGRRGLPAAIARLDEMTARNRALGALTPDDRNWLAAQGWTP